MRLATSGALGETLSDRGREYLHRAFDRLGTHDGQMLRMGCGPGGLAAACAFHAITDRLAGRTPKPLRVKGDALCISLGQRDGLLQPTDLDGSPRGKVRTGLPVAMMKKDVLRATGWYNLRDPALVVAGARFA